MAPTTSALCSYPTPTLSALFILLPPERRRFPRYPLNNAGAMSNQRHDGLHHDDCASSFEIPLNLC